MSGSLAIMFALEITFKGESPASEVVFIRRPLALVGADESAHVIIDEMRSLGYSILVSRDVGRKFTLTPVNSGDSNAVPSFLDGVFEGESSVDLGPVKLRFMAVDGDLILRETETPDRAGIRILRQAVTSRTPLFPALVVTSTPRVVLSFSPDHPILIGRSRQCSLRLDNSGISSRHARVGFEDGGFWVEDLGSSNGTFVNQQQVSGRVKVEPGAQIAFGRDVFAHGVVSADQVRDVISGVRLSSPKAASRERRFPILVSLSESARPARMVLSPGTSVSLGRDPGSDMWLGAPHVSRKHCAVSVSKAGSVKITDCSTNGTAYDGGMLRRDESAESSEKPLVLDFGGGVTVALCFSEADEQAFVAAGGSTMAFKAPVAADASRRQGGRTQPRARRTTAWLQAPVDRGISAEEGVNASRGGIRQLFSRLSTLGRVVLALAALGVFGLLAFVVSVLVMGFQG